MVHRIIGCWDRLERLLAAITILGAFILTFMEVIARFVFSYSFYWAKEYIIFMVIWSTLLGSSQVLKKSEHIRLSVFVDLLPNKGKHYFEILNIVLGLVFSVALFFSGCNLVSDAFVKGVTTTSLAKTPLWMPYSIMPIAGVLFLIRFLELFPKAWRKLQGENRQGGGEEA
jgi:C4-dicarboxylate transporter DctQ subunit